MTQNGDIYVRDKETFPQKAGTSKVLVTKTDAGHDAGFTSVQDDKIGMVKNKEELDGGIMGSPQWILLGNIRDDGDFC